MMMCQQVYVDISAINWLLTPEEFHAYLQQLKDARLGKRILFGRTSKWQSPGKVLIDAQCECLNLLCNARITVINPSINPFVVGQPSDLAIH
jgi:hypothetical protein